MKTSENNLLSENILDALASHIAIIDSDGTIQYVNKAWRDFALLNDGEIDKLGKGTNYLDICEQALGIAPSGEAVSALKGLRELLKGKREKFELMYPCHSPIQRRWFLMRCSRMTSGFELIVISHIDVTKQKEFEITLTEERARYQSVVETLMVGIAIANLDGIIQFVNPAFAKLYQYSSDEIVGMHVSKILSPEYHYEYKRFTEELSSTGYFEGNTIDVRKDGSTFHTEVRGVFIRYKNEPCYLALVNDISDSVSLEEARRKAEELYSALFEKNHSVILLIDPSSSKIIDANPAACKYYGYARLDMKSMPVAHINALTEEEIHTGISKVLSDQKKIFNLKHRLANGTLKDVEIYTGPMQVGEKMLLCSIIHDISDRKAIEQDREELIAKLQSAVEEIKTLQGILPICSFCKKIKNDKGYWENLEKYISEHSDAIFSHCLCMDCARKHYPEVFPS